MTQAPPLADRYQQARQMLDEIGQGHLLRFWDELSDDSRASLLAEIEGVDWPEVVRLIESHVKQRPSFKAPEQIEPAPWYPNIPIDEDQAHVYARARLAGESLVREGKVAAFTVAGGQGTRLGWDGPKGTFPATPVRKLPLFGCFAEYIRNIQARFDSIVPWYVMTSTVNDQPTRDFFQQQNYFGLDPQNVMFFPQQMMPAICATTHKVLLAAKDAIALSPNGHGGSLKALHTSGALDDMLDRGIEHISYTQVDNPIVRMVDPLFLGLHALDHADMSSKMLPKRDPFEKLGNFCIIDGKMTVIEYSNLPDELAVQRTNSGQLRFLAGSIAIHAIRVDFVRKLNTRSGGFALPWNRADKKVAYVDTQTGEPVEPAEANAVKLETFVFDALPLTGHSIIYETSRGDEFAPIKNASGEGVLDSPATSIDLQKRRAADWLESRGVKVPRLSDSAVNANIEIRQLTAIYPEDLDRLKLPAAIEEGSEWMI